MGAEWAAMSRMRPAVLDADEAARRRAWRKWAGPNGDWANQRAAQGPRDARAAINYFTHDSPRDFSTREYSGLVELQFRSDADNLLAEGTRSYDMTVLDARRGEGGLAGWDFDRNGFCFIVARRAWASDARHTVAPPNCCALVATAGPDPGERLQGP